MLAGFLISLTVWTLGSVVLGLTVAHVITFHPRNVRPVLASEARRKRVA